MLEGYSSHTKLTNRYERHWHTELLKRVAHGSHSIADFKIVKEGGRDEKII